MPDNLYCEPCRRFAQGEAFKIDEFDSGRAEFTHHEDFASFNEAIQLPCSICTLAWRDVQKPLSTYNGELGVMGWYSYSQRNNERRLWFFLLDRERNPGKQSNILALVPWPSELQYRRHLLTTKSIRSPERERDSNNYVITHPIRFCS
jgi:hypothetical protein